MGFHKIDNSLLAELLTDREEADRPDDRPVPVVAGHFREYVNYLRSSELRDLIDVRYVGRPESLQGLPLGDLVICVGSYASRGDWGEFKLTLDAFHATIEVLGLDG